MHLGHRPSARVYPRPGVVRLLQPGVHVHRDVVFLLAGFGHGIHITGIVPRHEDLVGGPTELPPTVQVRLLVGRAVHPDGHFEILGSSLSENLLPGARGLEPGVLPDIAELRDERVLVLLEVVHQFLGNRPVEGLVGRGRPVPRVEQDPDLVLHLDHDDRVLPAIHLLDMPHQRGEGAGVGVAVRLAEGGEQLDGLPALYPDARETLEVLLHPVGRVARETVLPACEPDEHKAQVVTPRIPDVAIQHIEVELAFPRLDLRPGNTRNHGVQFCRRELRPNRLHVLDARSAAVEQLPRQRQERLAIDHQLGGGPLLPKVRGVGNRPAGAVSRNQDQTADQGATIPARDTHGNSC